MGDHDEPGGYSAHGDWFNGWDTDVVNTFLEHCYRPAQDCGVDNLANGTTLVIP